MFLNEFGLTSEDMSIFEIMSNFNGVTYSDVLIDTVYFGKKETKMRNRLQKLKRKKLIRFVKTGLEKPKFAIFLTESGKESVNYIFNKNIKNSNFYFSTIYHNILEQKSFFWLKKAGREVERTTVSNWRHNGFYHTPDLIYKKEDKLIYVEVELNAKRVDQYLSIFEKMKQDRISSVLYIFQNEQKMKQIAKRLPTWEKLKLTYYDLLKNSVANNEKIKFFKKGEIR